MNVNAKYTADYEMRELISDNVTLLMVINRFGVSLGFGDSTIRKVCTEQNIDEKTFLTVVNFLSDRPYELDKIKLPSLLGYLEKGHDFFLNFNLPAIRRKLIEAINYSDNPELSMLIIKYYDRYVNEVKAHMDYENEKVFTYVRDLLDGIKDKHYSIRVFAEKHNHIDEKLSELKSLIIRYYPDKSNNDLLYSVLFDIINCEHDLISHCQVEDQLLLPCVLKLEKAVSEAKGNLPSHTAAEQDDVVEEHAIQLSQREKDILVCVAKGMTNKEIADSLFISVNTVTKHRYNITSKLQIHTPAGLTIYALVNNLVRLDEISNNLA